MKVVSNISTLIESGEVAISMGNFDGVHLGHQALLTNALNESKERGFSFGIITFVPHPAEIFKGVSNFYINSFEERRQLLERLGVKFIVELPFDEHFGKLGPKEFLNEYVLKLKGLKKIFLGYNFGLGKDKRGDLKFISEFVGPHNIELYVEDEFILDGNQVCSSKIREKIKEGDIPFANSMLNREFYLSGTVVPGAGRGSRIGIPTMNLEFDHKRLVPGRGVYVTRTEVKGKQNLSLTNIGYNPTFETNERVKVETHLLDFDEKHYGEEIRISFVEKIRDEKKFGAATELIKQINLDILYTKEKYL
ncbi:MAG: bifunctional riboflavin kinase/FAD synthetase [Deltaproteobacteria bacterium]|nr:MAG: bifunctional riboflavin kinase/FAD synthetase [Deltaproteobacteria bacterium]